MTPRQRIIDTLVLPVCQKHGIALDDVFGPIKTRAVVAARDEALSAVFDELRNLSATGRFFRKDHATVLIALGRHDHRCGVNSYRSRLYLRSRDRLRAKRQERQAAA